MRFVGLLTVVGECRVSVENGIKANKQIGSCHVLPCHTTKCI